MTKNNTTIKNIAAIKIIAQRRFEKIVSKKIHVLLKRCFRKMETNKITNFSKKIVKNFKNKLKNLIYERKIFRHQYFK